MEKTEMQPSSLAALTDDKLERSVLGHQKKTKFQKAEFGKYGEINSVKIMLPRSEEDVHVSVTVDS
ncbi:hypothetical protein PsorP6_009417 [Peronosclerospora sorghi]|uniref:Uncharacterized protein n=1 Tax=Peronosclerospora sorghi TaxID=230839 RepID=A0ACC0W1C4_9STRA|nr:hypothetical protein PsorP6_009417 [Peronosclerospora sorghi]